MKFISLLLIGLSLVACKKDVPGKTAGTDEVNECVSLTTCDLNSEDGGGLIKALLDNGLVNALKPYLPKGDTGAQGAVGPQGLQGEQGPQGPVGLPGLNGLDGLPGLNGLDGAPGLDGLPGLNGLDGAPGVKGDKGDKGDTGPAGPTGEKGEKGDPGSIGAQGGVGNTAVLSATKTFGPSGQDFNGSVTVSSPAVLVPPVLNVVYGNQNTGLAYVTFGDVVCKYTGNNKSGSALALFEFTSCADVNGPLTLGPGQPFAFTGTISISVGSGTGTSIPVQVVTFLQIQ